MHFFEKSISSFRKAVPPAPLYRRTTAKNNYYIYYNAQRREMSSEKCRKCDDSPIFLQIAKHQTLKRLVSF